MFGGSGGYNPDPTGVRLSNGAHLTDKMYRQVMTKLLEGVSRLDFDVVLFARGLMVNANPAQRDRIAQLMIALVDAGSDLYDTGVMEQGTTQAKRLRETADLYQMPRG